MHDAAVNLKSKDTYYFAVRLRLYLYSEFDKQLHLAPQPSRSRARCQVSGARLAPSSGPLWLSASGATEQTILAEKPHRSRRSFWRPFLAWAALRYVALSSCSGRLCRKPRKDVGIALTSPLVSSVGLLECLLCL